MQKARGYLNPTVAVEFTNSKDYHIVAGKLGLDKSVATALGLESGFSSPTWKITNNRFIVILVKTIAAITVDMVPSDLN